jgi:hypothetical protein
VLDINLFKTFKVVVALNLIPLSKQPEKEIAHCLGDIPVYWQQTTGQQFAFGISHKLPLLPSGVCISHLKCAGRLVHHLESKKKAQTQVSVEFLNCVQMFQDSAGQT